MHLAAVGTAVMQVPMRTWCQEKRLHPHYREVSNDRECAQNNREGTQMQILAILRGARCCEVL